MASYETIHVEQAVRVRVPAQHLVFMKHVDEHYFADDSGHPIRVSPHWRSGLLLQGTGVVVNRHFYGVEDEDLGKHVVAEVRVVKKKRSDGQVFLLLDIHKCQTPTRSLTELKFVSGNGDVEGTKIPGTNVKVAFRPRPVNPKSVEA